MRLAAAPTVDFEGRVRGVEHCGDPTNADALRYNVTLSVGRLLARL